MTDDNTRVHDRGRPATRVLEPMDDDAQIRARCLDNVDRCNELLARLLKHHPEHERPVNPRRR